MFDQMLTVSYSHVLIDILNCKTVSRRKLDYLHNTHTHKMRVLH